MEEYLRWLHRLRGEVEYKSRNPWSRYLVDRSVISLAFPPVFIPLSSLCALDFPHHVRTRTVMLPLRCQPRSS